ncbi:ABC transporter ATP-binding protein [Clostridium sp. 'deep sea']|uniref:ABC transporter ATP-binding protein n=1 Tax=Clostridium sp. 'deep sea' TaxID=2779445 RepID=UPI0018968063|nr:ABC transporter ATP-binding protein [Clostridium sp. 'deep sea']QOR36880.1 ABC transporter ATP-binding protein [Clostridium sp. 'deep sea']
MLNDKTRGIEHDVQSEQKPKAKHLFKLFLYVFSTTKAISLIYLGLYIVLSLLRPVLAFMWGRYIQTAKGLTHVDNIFPAILLLLSYFIINFIIGLIDRYVGVYERIEMLNIVQANHQAELLRSKMYEKFASISPEYYEIPKINDNMTQVFNFVSSQWRGINTTVMMQGYIVIAKAISIVTIAASLYIFNPLLCLIVLVAPLPTLWSLTIGQKIRFKFVKDNVKLKRRAEYFQGVMLSSAGKELKVLGLHDFFYKKWKDIADEYTLKEKKLIRTQAILQIINYFLLSLANVGGCIFAIVLMAMGRLTLGALGAVLSLVSTLVNDTKELLVGFVTVYMKKNEAAQFFDLMELPEQKNEGEDLGKFNVIEAKRLKYRYPLTKRYVLDDINLRIRKGEKVAFVGENGMGKTTFVKLITGTLTPSDGELLINDALIEQINPIVWYNNISAVVQDPARYITFSIADNVFLGDTVKPRNEVDIDKALSFSGLNGVERNNLLGKDIGGTELSGGQWQKLSIARAAYRNKDFIILDEPTSNLDPLAETDVFQKYISLAKDKTVIFVTHRISVASLADRIVVFADGRIIQDGTHEDLIAQGGEYSRLYREQAKWYNR